MNLSNHPCFNAEAHKHSGRVHLPVAPRCNIQCKFCNRKFDCVNETRPGVTSGVLTPFQAMAYLEAVLESGKNIAVVGIAGPGDPFANPDETLATLDKVRERYPEMMLCVATNGLNIGPYLDDMAAMNVSHVTVTVNAVDPKIGADIYAWVRYNKRVMQAEAGVEILLEKQLQAIQGLKEHNITVKVNSIIIPGINDRHIEDVAKKMAAMGVDIVNCVPYYPCAGSAFEHMEEPSAEMVKDVRQRAGKYIPMMHHCTRCRADAVGLLGEAADLGMINKLLECAHLSETKPGRTFDTNRPHVAVASMEGVLINQHLGEASKLLIYEEKDGIISLLEARDTPQAGRGFARWNEMTELLDDCRTLLVSGIGDNPRQAMTKSGIEVMVVEGIIEDAVQAVFAGDSLQHLIKRDMTRCGTACSGGGMGCG